MDSEAEEEVTRILAELDGARVVTEPLIEIEAENESGRKCLVHVPRISSSAEQGDSGRTRATSFHTAPESAGGVTEDTVPLNDIELPDLSTRM